MAQLLAGTSGFSFKEWIGPFYPPKTAAADMLRYYASKLGTVEINNTFYRMPTPSMLERWRDEVPAGFRFSLKAPRRITHERRLVGAAADVAEFCKRAGALGNERLAALLFQLPPSLKKDVPRLADFLAVLPVSTPAAFEFRHESWLDEEVYGALRERGVMLCVADTDDGETPFVVTAGNGYVRLRRTYYDDDELRAWAEKIAAQKLERCHLYFMHEDEALGTKFAERLMHWWRELGGA